LADDPDKKATKEQEQERRSSLAEFERRLLQVFTKYREWYSLLTLRSHNEATLEQLGTAGRDLIKLHTVFGDIGGPNDSSMQMIDLKKASAPCLSAFLTVLSEHHREGPSGTALPCCDTHVRNSAQLLH
jgi:hypothetical protein